jgi:chromatin segregation and condensation protein Rec8/ScpA/Scc1 (kleisin family)
VEVAVIFLAMLELIRVNRIRIVQKEPFGIIEVYRVSQDISTESSEDSGFVTDTVETAPVDS